MSEQVKQAEQSEQPQEAAAVAAAATDATSAASKAGGKRRRLRGVVVCDRADKTVRVRIERRVRHPLYEKIIRRHSNVQAHDADNRCKVGDTITLEETPRFSKTKSWIVVEEAAGAGAGK